MFKKLKVVFLAGYKKNIQNEESGTGDIMYGLGVTLALRVGM